MDAPPLLDDLAHLFALIFGWQVVLLSGAMVAGSLLVSLSIVIGGVIRRDVFSSQERI
jgi:hypothetical protein